MIGRLTGLLAAKRAPQILVECHGVGYEADVSMTTFLSVARSRRTGCYLDAFTG